MEAIFIPIISALASVVANAIYLSFVKKDLDKRLESYKIAYSGIFKEKLDLYKKLIEEMEELKTKILTYGHQGEVSNLQIHDLMQDVNRFIKLNEFGSIFYNTKIENIISDIRKEFQDVLDLSFKRVYAKANNFEFGEFEIYLKKLTDLTNGKKYSELKKQLIQSIREDFNIH